MFKKKKNEPEFVPKYFVYVEYGNGLSMRTGLYDSRDEVSPVFQKILKGAGSTQWTEIDGNMIRSNAIVRASLRKTHKRGHEVYPR